MERRLAAILTADVVGYSRLMGEDETGTLAALKTHRAELIDPKAKQYGGRTIKLMGDGILMEFASVVDAVGFAVDVQYAMQAYNDSLRQARQILYRVGINIGDVIVDGDDIYGDGVNVAARLENLADAGGVCIGRNVRDQIRDKLELNLEDLGEVEVKNIARPVRAFRIVMDDKVSALSTPIFSDEARSKRTSRAAVAGAVGLVVLAVGGAAFWWQPWAPGVKSATEVSTTLPVSDKPSIAVLPFQNMSNDKNQDYFAEGIAEDVITDLSKISGLFVIARNTSFQYRGGALDLTEVGRKLGVRYILEGSVRRAGDQVRITAQLIDSTTGGHVWAERYDGTLANVFSVQDKVTGQIIGALKLELTPTERQAVELHGTNKPEAFDAYLRGLRLLSARKNLDTDGNRAAQSAFEEAIRIDPEYALAYAGLGWAKWLYHETIDIYDGKSRIEAIELARKSIALRDNALAHRILAREHFSLLSYWTLATRKMDLAVIEFEAAAQLQPNNPDVLTDLSLALCFAGRPDEALELVQKAMERNPNHPGWYYAASGIAFLLTEKPDLAVRDLKKWSNSNPNGLSSYVFLASALALSGDEVQANAKLARFEFLNSVVPFSEAKATSPFDIRLTSYAVKKRWPMAAKHEEIFLKGLYLAGLKETPN